MCQPHHLQRRPYGEHTIDHRGHRAAGCRRTRGEPIAAPAARCGLPVRTHLMGWMGEEAGGGEPHSDRPTAGGVPGQPPSRASRAIKYNRYLVSVE